MPPHELAGSTSRAFDEPEQRPSTCEACGGWHGGVNEERNCLLSTVRAQRIEIATLRGKLVRIMQPQDPPKAAP